MAYTWDEIENRLKDEKIVEIVRYIKSSGLSSRLFAYTSHEKLVINAYEPVEHTRDSLHIDFDKFKNQYRFQYFSIPHNPPELDKMFPSEQGIEKFKKIVKVLNW